MPVLPVVSHDAIAWGATDPILVVDRCPPPRGVLVDLFGVGCRGPADQASRPVTRQGRRARVARWLPPALKPRRFPRLRSVWSPRRWRPTVVTSRRRRALPALARCHPVRGPETGHRMTWQLRRAGLDDLESIMAIESSTFGTDAWSSATMRAELADRHGYYLVAFPPGEPSRVDAYAGLRSPRRRTASRHSDDRGRRVGEARGPRSSAHASAHRRGSRSRRDRGVPRGAGRQSGRPGALRLLGFEQIAVRPKYYQPDGVDAIIMRLTIPAAEVRPA